MNRFALLALLTVCVWGCAQKTSETAQRTEAPAQKTVETPAVETPVPAHDAGAIAVPAAVTLDGTMGCGHCTFHTTQDCAIAMKTDDGRIVVIDASKLANEDHLFAERMEGKAVSVQGNVEEIGGQLVIRSEDVTFR